MTEMNMETGGTGGKAAREESEGKTAKQTERGDHSVTDHPRIFSASSATISAAAHEYRDSTCDSGLSAAS